MKWIWVTLLLAAPAWSFENQVEFNWGHGVPQATVSVGNSSDELGSSGNVWSADILHLASRQTYLGLGGGQYRSGDNTSGSFIRNTQSTLAAKTSSVLILGRIDFPHSSKLVTYVIGGIGWVRNSLSITAYPTGLWNDSASAEQRTFLSTAKSTLGFAGGLGLDLDLTQTLVFGIEGRYQTSLKQYFDLTPEGQAATGQTSISSLLKIYTICFKVGIKY